MERNTHSDSRLGAGSKDTGAIKRVGVLALVVGWAGWTVLDAGCAGATDSLSVTAAPEAVHATHVGPAPDRESPLEDDYDGGSFFPGLPSSSLVPDPDTQATPLTEEMSRSRSAHADGDYGVWWSVP